MAAEELSSNVLLAIGSVGAAAVTAIASIVISRKTHTAAIVNQQAVDRAAAATIAEMANDHLIKSQGAWADKLMARMEHLEKANEECQTENRKLHIEVVTLRRQLDYLNYKINLGNNVLRIGDADTMPDAFRIPDDSSEDPP